MRSLKMRRPFMPPQWDTRDDRLRGGKSTSSLSSIDDSNSAHFHGNLDIQVLGAGFASQFSSRDAPPVSITGLRCTGNDGGCEEERFWDLSSYDGLEIMVKNGQECPKRYTLILKDELSNDTDFDREERASLSWEVSFDLQGNHAEGCSPRKGFWFPWHAFNPFYRGKELDQKRSLNAAHIRKVGIMMRR